MSAKHIDVLESGDSGWFWHPDEPERKLHGEFRVDPAGWIRVELLQKPSDFEVAATEPDLVDWKHDLSIVHGKSARLGALTLLAGEPGGFDFRSPREANSVYFFRHLTWGEAYLEEADEAFFRRIEVQLAGLGAMLPSNPLDLSVDSDGSSTAFTARLNHHEQCWVSPGKVVTWRRVPIASQEDSATTNEFSLSTTTALRIDVEEPRSFAQMLEEFIWPTMQLVTLAVGEDPKASGIVGWDGEYGGRERSLKAMNVWTSGVANRAPSWTPDAAFLAYGVSWETMEIQEVLNNVRRINEDYPLLVSMTIGVSSLPDRPARNRYLDLISGLESYHSIRYGHGDLPIDDHRRIRSEILERITSTGELDATEGKFLKQHLATRPSKALHRRLADLYAQLEVPMTERIGVEAMAELRNSIAHGERIDATFLRTAYHAAEEIARKILLDEIGVDWSPPDRESEPHGPA